MSASHSCPLPPALRALLETAVALRTTNNQILANALFCSEETIKSRFRRLSLLLGTHSRTEVLLTVLLQGWILLPQSTDQSEVAWYGSR